MIDKMPWSLLLLSFLTYNVFTLQGQEFDALIPYKDSYPNWSPDGSRLIYSSDVNSPNVSRIFMLDLENSNTEQLSTATQGWGDFNPKFSPDGSKIAFLSERDGNREVYVMNSDGSDPINLTNNAERWDGNDIDWTPDGKSILYSSSDFGSTNSEIYLVDLQTKKKIQLTKNPASDYAACVSPNGKRIAFVSNRDGNNEIYVMEINGDNIERITYSWSIEEGVDWSPDGESLLFQSDRDDISFELYTIHLKSKEINRITTSPNEDKMGQWSPNGAQIVYVSSENGFKGISIVDRNGTSKRKLTNRKSSDFANHIIKNGLESGLEILKLQDAKNEYFARDEFPMIISGFATQGKIEEAKELAAFYFNGDKNEKTTFYYSDFLKKLGHNTPPTHSIFYELVLAKGVVSADKRWQSIKTEFSGWKLVRDWQIILFGKEQFLDNKKYDEAVLFYKMVVDMFPSSDYAYFYLGKSLVSAQKKDEAKTAFVRCIQNSPDGWLNKDARDALKKLGGKITNTIKPSSLDRNRLVFQSDIEGNNEIYQIHVNGTKLKRLTYNDFPDSDPSLSPDGKRIVFARTPDGHTNHYDIYLINSDGTNETRLTHSPGPDINPSFKGDSTVVYSSGATGNQEILEVDLSTKKTSQLTFTSCDNTNPIAFGDWIYFVSNKSGRNEIYRLKRKGVVQRLTSIGASGISISPTGKEILFHSGKPGREDLFKMNSDGAHVEQLTKNDTVRDRFPTWSKDEASFYFNSNRDGNEKIYEYRFDTKVVKRIF
jgi:TolB protein